MIQKILILVADAFHFVREGDLLPAVEPEDFVAERPDLRKAVADKDGGGPVPDDLHHLCFALFPEGAVPDGQDFIQDQDIRLQQAGDGESQPAFHAGGKVIEKIVLELLKFCESDDLIVFFVHKLTGITEKGAPQECVFPHGQAAVKTAAELQQGGDGASADGIAFRGFHHAGKCFQQCAFSGAVGADDTQHISLFQREIDIPVRPEGFDVIGPFDLPENVFLETDIPEIPRQVANGNIADFDDLHCASYT